MAHRLKSPRIAEHYHAIQLGGYGQLELNAAGTDTSPVGQYFGVLVAQSSTLVNYKSVDFEGNVINTFTGVIIPAGTIIKGLMTDVVCTSGKIVLNYASVDE